LADRREFWYERLKAFVPGCIYGEDEGDETEAIFRGFAEVLNALDCMARDHVRETFICDSTGAFLNEHANERSIERTTREIDSSLAQRTKNITNSASCPDLKELVDSLLDVGESVFIEDDEDAVFFNRENFYNRGDLLFIPILNAFSILVDRQVHEPFSFYNRNDIFYNREVFMGTNESSFELFQRIVQAVNTQKACGAAFRLIERIA